MPAIPGAGLVCQPSGIADFNANHKSLKDAPDIFNRDFAAPVEKVFRDSPEDHSPEITVFTEFFGPHSFAGSHKTDDPKQLVLFDVETERGLIGPEQFIADFGALKIARVVYRGKLTGNFTHNVREGKYDVTEGVLCKGGSGGDDLWMVKIKTNAYMERLKQAFKDDWEAYWE